MTILSNSKEYLANRLRGLIAPLEQNCAKAIILQSLIIAKENRRKESIRQLSEVEFSGFSQWGEDGVIDWLVERLPNIPNTFGRF